MVSAVRASLAERSLLVTGGAWVLWGLAGHMVTQRRFLPCSVGDHVVGHRCHVHAIGNDLGGDYTGKPTGSPERSTMTDQTDHHVREPRSRTSGRL